MALKDDAFTEEDNHSSVCSGVGDYGSHYSGSFRRGSECSESGVFDADAGDNAGVDKANLDLQEKGQQHGAGVKVKTEPKPKPTVLPSILKTVPATSATRPPFSVNSNRISAKKVRPSAQQFTAQDKKSDSSSKVPEKKAAIPKFNRQFDGKNTKYEESKKSIDDLSDWSPDLEPEAQPLTAAERASEAFKTRLEKRRQRAILFLLNLFWTRKMQYGTLSIPIYRLITMQFPIVIVSQRQYWLLWCLFPLQECLVDEHLH